MAWDDYELPEMDISPWSRNTLLIFKWQLQRTIIISVVGAVLFLMATMVLKDQLNFLFTDVIKTIIKIPVIFIILLEVIDALSDRSEFLRKMWTGIGVGPIFPSRHHPMELLEMVIKLGVIIVTSIFFVGIFAGGYTFPVVLVGVIIGSYILTPLTGDDSWLLATWLACSITALITGLMTFNEIVVYQTQFWLIIQEWLI